MTTLATASKRSAGRPRLDRDRHIYCPAVEYELLEDLAEQADAVGVGICTYLEHLVSEAHDYHGQYLRELSALPRVVDPARLRATADDMTPEQCRPTSGPAKRQPVRLDRELADHVNQRCAELDVAYAHYLRAIFREAAGRTTPSPRHDQLAVEIDSRGEVRLPKAG